MDFAVGVAGFVAAIVAFAAAAPAPKHGTAILLLAVVVASLVYMLYEVVLVAMWGRTLGKQVMGLEVVRDRGGGHPRLTLSLLRNMVPAVLLIGFPLLYPLPFVWAAVAKDHRGPHDRLAGTRVVSRSG